MIVDTTLYQQIIGSLLYLGLRTRLDILPAVLILARFQKAPTPYCFHQAAKRVLRYLSGTKNYGIKYVSAKIDVSCFVDLDFAGDQEDRKSMSGYLVKLGNAVCLWGSKKQPTVALSTCEAEYNAMTHVAKEVIWMSRVIEEAGWKLCADIVVRSDNQSAIRWATSEQSSPARAKHIDVQVHFVRELVNKSVLSIQYVATEENEADILTKPVETLKLQETLKRIGIGPIEEEC